MFIDGYERIFAHCRNTAYYATGILDHNKLYIACLLHDIGKKNVPLSILNTTRPLTEQELAIIKHHPQEGAALLLNRGYTDDIVKAVLYHHERWDGSGYPYGLKGENIPIYSRALAVADAFDAMTSNRPYKKTLPVNAALAEIAVNAGTQFDPVIAEVFLNMIRVNKYKLIPL